MALAVAAIPEGLPAVVTTYVFVSSAVLLHFYLVTCLKVYFSGACYALVKMFNANSKSIAVSIALVISLCFHC